MSYFPLDRDKKPIAVGDTVRVIDIPTHLPQGLPQEDQAAIFNQVGRTLAVVGFDVNGNAELEFVDDTGCIHTIWIAPDFLACET